jgi:predicted DNA-binding WGR domain protein
MVVCLHNHDVEANHDKVYVCRVDYVGGVKPFRVVAAWGRATKPKVQAEQTKDEFAGLNDAVRLMDQLIQDKINGGYQNVQDVLYGGTLSMAQILAKVDMTRCYSDKTPIPAPVVPKKVERHTDAGISRAARLIQCND